VAPDRIEALITMAISQERTSYWTLERRRAATYGWSPHRSSSAAKRVNHCKAPGELSPGASAVWPWEKGLASYLFRRLSAHAALPTPASIKAIALASKAKVGQAVVDGVAPLPPVDGSVAGVAGATVGVGGATVGRTTGVTAGVGVGGATVGRTTGVTVGVGVGVGVDVGVGVAVGVGVGVGVAVGVGVGVGVGGGGTKLLTIVQTPSDTR
jgi:hypothetical protein